MRATGTLETIVGEGGYWGGDGLPLTVAYSDENIEGIGLPLVCVPGIGVLQSDFGLLEASSVFKNRRRLSFDLPGQGQSTYPYKRGTLGVSHFVELVHDLTVISGTNSFILLGVGLGANTAFRYAQRYPERVAGLVSVGGTMRSQDSYTTSLIAGGVEDTARLGKRYRMSEHPLRAQYGSTLRGRKIQTHISRLLATAAYDDAKTAPPLQAVGRLEVPMAYVQGEQTLEIDGYANQLRDAGVNVLPIPDAADFPHPGVDNPEHYLRALGSAVTAIEHPY